MHVHVLFLLAYDLNVHVYIQCIPEICCENCSSKSYLLVVLPCRIYEMELRLDTPIKFRHPCYEALTWFAAKDYINELNSYSEKGIPPPIYLLEGMKEMLYCFSRWTRSREVSTLTPPDINFHVPRNKLVVGSYIVLSGFNLVVCMFDAISFCSCRQL